VQRLIATTVGESARNIRDRAILILLATYGGTCKISRPKNKTDVNEQLLVKQVYK
jgi:hypothetical protein